MSAPRSATSLRGLIRFALLCLFASKTPTIGSPVEIAKGISAPGYNPNSLKVQVAQVRNDLFDELGVRLPFAVRGRLSNEQIARIEAKLKNPVVQAQAKRLKMIELNRKAAAA